MTIRFYNSLTNQKEDFVPIRSGEVGMYVCGMTVYDNCHLGHARAMMAFDILVRYLRNQGLIDSIDDIISVDVKWDIGISEVITKNKNTKQILKKLEKKTITTGCGQGTIFGSTLEKLYEDTLPEVKIK